MATTYHPGQKWKISGDLTDKLGASILFSDVTEISIVVRDERGVSKTFTKADGEVLEGSNTSSYKFEVSAAESSDFTEGKIYKDVTWKYPSSDFTSGVADDKKNCIELFEIECP